MVNRRCHYFAAAFLLAFFALATRAINVQAGPPAPIDIVVTQPDGSAVTLRQWGDEWQHGMETPDGFTVLQDEASGAWVYAALQEDGSLAPASADGQMLVVGVNEPAGLEPYVRPAPDSNTRRESAQYFSSEPARAQISGEVPLLVILAEFNDQKHNTVLYQPTYFPSLAFGASGSIKDYYNKASFGKLNIVPAAENEGTANDGVIGWVNIGINHPNSGSDIASYAIARAAITAANNSSNINFASYDDDSDGYITSKELLIEIVAAGYEGSYNNSSPSVWAHQWDLDGSGTELVLDGKRVAHNNPNDGDYGGYLIVGERHGDHAATVGTIVHETGHLISWPDLYDITPGSGSDSEGVGNWSVMGGGSWNRISASTPGDSPALPDAWLKWYQGWLTPTTGASGASYSLANANANASAVLIGSNPNGVDWNFDRRSGTGQFWLVENRQLSGYDAGLPGCGLLIWHIDESVTSTNYANANRDHPLMELEQADGNRNLYYKGNRGDAGDPFPGTSGKLVFNNTSTPNSRYYSGASSYNNIALTSNSCQSSMGFTYTRNAPVAQPGLVYLPYIARPSTDYATGTLTDNGAPVAGQTVVLMRSTTGNVSGGYYPYDRAVTDANGAFSLLRPALTTTNHKYYIRWQNPNSTSSDGRLVAFYSYVAGNTTTNHNYPINIHDVVLNSPGNGASVYMPAYFTWTRRSTTTDSYVLELYMNGLDDSPNFTDQLGYTDRVTVTGLPSDAETNTEYYWSIRVHTPSVGYGEAYWANSISFKTLSGPALDGAPLAGWSLGADMEAIPNDDTLARKLTR